MTEREPVLLDRHGAVAVITLNRPERSNAIDPATADRIADCVARIEADDGIRAAVLTGAGDRAFCAGSDLRAKSEGAPPAMARDWGFAGFVRAPRTKPFVAAVNGAAVGGGFEIVLACELAVASTTAVFGLPEVGRGLVAGGGGLVRLPRRIPPAIAAEVALAGRTLDAAEALDLGLVNAVADPAGLPAAAIDLAERCAHGAPLAVRETIAVMRAAGEAPEDDLWARSDRASTLMAASADGREGPLAFAQKRHPQWLGR